MSSLIENARSDETQLVVCVCGKSKLFRVKVCQGLSLDTIKAHESTDVDQLLKDIVNYYPSTVFLNYPDSSLPSTKTMDAIAGLGVFPRPRIILCGNQDQLGRDVEVHGVDGLLCSPFLPEMVILKMRGILAPEKSFYADQERVLKAMRKYQRFAVSGMNCHFHKPVQERCYVVDISYQGLKATTQNITKEFVGETFQMQLSGYGGILVLEGTAVWVRQGAVGISFNVPRPSGFASFFKLVIKNAESAD